MCRYALFGPYKEHYACFSCRKMFRRPSRHGLLYPPPVGQVPVAPCPDCGQPMRDMGRDFKAPKRSDVEQWKKVVLLYTHGYTFHSCGCDGPGPRPKRLKDVAPFLAKQRHREETRERQQRLASAERERNRRRKKRAEARQSKRIARQARQVA